MQIIPCTLTHWKLDNSILSELFNETYSYSQDSRLCQTKKWGFEGPLLWLDDDWPGVHKMGADNVESPLSLGITISGLCPNFLIIDH